MGGGYDFYLDRCLLPVAPEKLEIGIKNVNKTVTLINEGQVNLLKAAGLTDIDFECCIPQVEYPFAVYKSGFQGAEYYLSCFEKLKSCRRPFQFIVARRMPGGGAMFGTNIKVSMEEYRIVEDAGNGFDLTVKIELKQYREYGTHSAMIKGGKAVSAETPVQTVTVRQTRAAESAPATDKVRAYTVRPGDTLYSISKELYGDGSKYMDIYNANRSAIAGGPLDIRAGQSIRIPAR